MMRDPEAEFFLENSDDQKLGSSNTEADTEIQLRNLYCSKVLASDRTDSTWIGLVISLDILIYNIFFRDFLTDSCSHIL